MDFTEVESKCCEIVGRSTVVIRNQALILKASLLNRGVFTASTTYNEVVENKDFMDVLLMKIKIGFSEDKTTSYYGTVEGKPLIDDFSLIQIAPKEIMNHCPLITAQEYVTLTKNRKNALVALDRMRKSMILFMNFEGTPATPSPIKTKDEMKRCIGNSIDQMSITSQDDISDITQGFDMVRILYKFYYLLINTFLLGFSIKQGFTSS